jgi:hypothetical protein
MNRIKLAIDILWRGHPAIIDYINSLPKPAPEMTEWFREQSLQKFERDREER